MNFDAAILTEVNQPLVVESIELDKTLCSGQVLVKINYSGVCRSQIMEQRGKRGKDKYLPHLLGHEAFGVVVDCADDVKKVNIGDNVILSWLRGSGISAETPTYKSKLGRINSGQISTFSEYTVVSENCVYLKPRFIPDHYAPFFGCAVPTGSGSILNSKIPIGNKCLIFGCGGIGIHALCSLRSKNPKLSVSVLDRQDDRLSDAKVLGADHLYKSIEEIGDNKFDFIFESCGLTDTIELAFSLLKPTGSLIFASHPQNGMNISLDPFQLIQGRSIFGTWGGWTNLDTQLRSLHDSIAEFYPILSHLNLKEYSLEKVNDALKDLENGTILRPILKLNS